MRARDVERMEAELAALRRRVAPEPRPLMGYGRAVGEVQDILRDIRREADAQFEARMADIFGDAPAAHQAPPVEPGEVGAPPAARAAHRRGK